MFLYQTQILLRRQVLRKFFNTLEFQAKYKNTIGKHKFYIFSLTRLNSCQKEMKFLPQYNLKPITLLVNFHKK